MSEKKNNTSNPFFIIGNPRSGTTLLRLMLNQHSFIIVPPECGFSVWLSDQFDKADFSSSETVNEFVSQVTKARKFETWGLEEQEIKDFLLRKVFKSYKEVVLEIYLLYASKHNKQPSLIGDKNNFYIKHLERLDFIFDKPKYVFIVRDGRDVACSYLALKSISSQSEYAPRLPSQIVDIAKEWDENNQMIISHLTSFPSQGMLIKYEELISNPEGELLKACDFLGVAYQPTMLAYHQDNDEPTDFLAWKKKVLQPPDPKNSGMYKNQLSPEEIGAFNNTAEMMLRYFGYLR